MKREAGARPVRARHCKRISVNRGKAPATGNGKAFTRSIRKPGDLPTVVYGIKPRALDDRRMKTAALFCRGHTVSSRYGKVLSAEQIR